MIIAGRMTDCPRKAGELFKGSIAAHDVALRRSTVHYTRIQRHVRGARKESRASSVEKRDPVSRFDGIPCSRREFPARIRRVSAGTRADRDRDPRHSGSVLFEGASTRTAHSRIEPWDRGIPTGDANLRYVVVPARDVTSRRSIEKRAIPSPSKLPCLSLQSGIIVIRNDHEMCLGISRLPWLPRLQHAIMFDGEARRRFVSFNFSRITWKGIAIGPWGYRGRSISLVVKVIDDLIARSLTIYCPAALFGFKADLLENSEDKLAQQGDLDWAA